MRKPFGVYSPSATEVFVDNARLLLPTRTDESDVITGPAANVYIILCVRTIFTWEKLYHADGQIYCRRVSFRVQCKYAYKTYNTIQR